MGGKQHALTGTAKTFQQGSQSAGAGDIQTVRRVVENEYRSEAAPATLTLTEIFS